MKKLTAVLIAVFLFPASFALGGEHPALADSRPSLVNDDLAFAFHGDVPLRAEFLSSDEMAHIRGDGAVLEALLWLWLVKETIVDPTLSWTTGKDADAHLAEIGALAIGYLIKTKPTWASNADFQALLNQPHGEQMQAEIQKMLAYQDFASVPRWISDAIAYGFEQHFKNETQRMIERYGLDDFTAGVITESSNTTWYEVEGDKKLSRNALVKQNALAIVKKNLGTILADIVKNENIVKAFKSDTTTPNQPSLPNGGWLLEEEGEEYDQSELSQLYMPLSDGHIYSLYGYSFGGVGVQTGSSYGNRTGGYQTGYCVGNTCTVTWHYRPRRSNQPTSVSRPTSSVSRQPSNVSLF